MKILFLIFFAALFGCSQATDKTKDATTDSAPVITENPPELKQSSTTETPAVQDTTAAETAGKQSEQNRHIRKPYKKTFSSGSVKFHVFSLNEKGSNQLKIKTEDFEIINDSFTHKINGQVTNAEVADLNKDNFPELYIFYSSGNNNNEGDIIAYNSNRNKSATPVYVRHPAKNDALMKDYNGNDEFSIEGNKLIRTFNRKTAATGKIIYKLIKGETSLILETDKAATQSAN